MNKESIFAEALKKGTATGRSEFLDKACGDNLDLRTEIEALLAAYDDAGSFLNRPPEELDATTGASRAASNDDFTGAWRELLEPSEEPDCLGTLGPYEINELVGRGGMGVVLRAHDRKLNRTVAIKLLAPELAANAMAVRRFLREAQAAAAVSHDHVVTIHAIDEQSQPPLIVMEYVDGQSLQQKIDGEGALDVKTILRISMQTAAGLAAPHRQGLEQRDIKPANILLENGIERVKLTDFGLARAVDDIGVTRTGQITGTPQYMSPEQAQGERVDHRTDLFSLGCVLYSMCTGRAAFRADSAVAVMHRIVHDDPKPIQKANSEIPEWLCRIVDKLLAKMPDDRFRSAEEVEDLLGRHLAHLQQPESVPRPKPIGHSVRAPASHSIRQRDAVPPDVAKRLRFVRNVLAVFGILALLWFMANLFMPYNGAAKFGFTMPTLLFSLVTGVFALNGAWHAMHHRSFGWTLLGNVVLLFPVNIPQMFGLFFTVWSSTMLWRDDVRKAFDSERDDVLQPYGNAPPHPTNHAKNIAFGVTSADAARRSWLRRVPIPAWIAVLLFAVVYLCALSEWTGLSHELSARPNGIGFYLLATGFVLVWSLCAVATRLIRGPRAATLNPLLRPTPQVMFFGATIVMTGVFVWQWTDLSNYQQRERMLAFFVGHGAITLELGNPQGSVEFNGRPIHVPSDGIVVIRPDKPGYYMSESRNESGWVTRSESLVHSGQQPTIRILKEATTVSVTGPVRGSFDQEPSFNDRVQPEPSVVIGDKVLGDAITNLKGEVQPSNETARFIITTAIQAHGGAEIVAKWKSARVRIKGTVTFPTGQRMPMAVEDVWEFPDRFRTTREIDRGGKTTKEVVVLSNGHGWLHVDGQTQPLPVLSEMQEQLYCQSFDKLFPLLQANDHRTILPLSEALVNGVSAIGVVISSPGHRDVQLFFEKSTGLLIKRQHTILDAVQSEVAQEVAFSGHKEIDGLMHWTNFTVTEDDRQTVSGELVEFTFEDGLDPSIFDRP